MKVLVVVSMCLLSTMAMLGQYTITGKVTDKKTGEILIAANAYLQETMQGASVDFDGNFVLDVAAGSYTLRVTYLGYKEYSQKVEVNSNLFLGIAMIPDEDIISCDFTPAQRGSATSFEKISPMAVQHLSAVYIEATAATANTPIAHQTLSKSHLDKTNNGQDLPYMLRFTPSLVTTSDAGNGIGYTGMRIRGSDASRINVTINDIPLNDPESQAVFWVNLPDLGSSASSIQIQRGVGTSTNGAGAFGGSVKINTSALSTQPSVILRNTAGSFQTFRNTVEINSGMIANRWMFQGRLSQILSDGYIDRASADLKSYFLSGAYVGPRLSLRAYAFGGHERTYQSWYGTPESRLENDTEAMLNHAINNGYSQAQTDNLLNAGRTYNYYLYDNEVDDYAQDHYQLHLGYNLPSSLYLKLAAHYTYGRGYFEQYREDDLFVDYGLLPLQIGGATITNTDLVRRRWLQNDFYGGVGSLQWDRGAIRSILGGAYHIYDGDHYGELIWMEHANGTEPEDVYYLSDALKKDGNVYWKTDLQLTNQFQAFVDLQYRAVLYQTEGLDADRTLIDTEDSLNFFNPKVGLTYRLRPNQEVYASYAIGNREPNRADYIDAPDGTFPRPERMQDIELGYKRSAERYYFGINLYSMQYTDQLVLTGELNDVGTPIRQNVASSFRNGAEVELAWSIYRGITWRGNATLSQNKIDAFDELIYDYTDDGFAIDTVNHSQTDISFSPNFVAASTLTFNLYESGDSKLVLDWMLKHVGKQYLDNTENDDRSLDAYTVSDFRLAFSFGSRLAAQTELVFQVNNALDLEYSSNGYTYSYVYDQLVTENFYYPQAGRNYLVSLNMRF